MIGPWRTSRAASIRLVRRSTTLTRRLRSRARASELFFVGLAILVGSAAGLGTLTLGWLARACQHLVFQFPMPQRLSGLAELRPDQLAILPIGGLILVAFTWVTRARRRTLVDAVEANALHGGRMSVPDSLVVSGQTVLSNGFGASVGLEAAYAQMGGVIASVAARVLSLRRASVRTLVGAGTGGAIAAAFGAPLAGSFYAFEVVIGAYTPSAIAPVVAAALAGAQVAQRLGSVPYIVAVRPGPAIHVFGYLVYAGLGLACALLGIVIMRMVAVVEVQSRRFLAWWLRPALGGLCLVPLALYSPQVLSAGHSALHLDLVAVVPLDFLGAILLFKSLASIVSLGFGFRGGLFFASLFLGTVTGHLYAGIANFLWGVPVLDPGNAAMVGMAAFATAVVGGPFCMAMLVLEATGNFSLTGAVLCAGLVSSTIVRESFGYSFSTWRLHLRGETIQSARDVGWVKTLTAGRMMRRATETIALGSTVAEFRRRYPLGSTNRVVVTDDAGHYEGILAPSRAFAEGVEPESPIAPLVRVTDFALGPAMDIAEVLQQFDEAEADELAVLDDDGQVLGILSESFVRRRYAEELEKAQRELFGER